jgi:hypothetical protein
MMKHMIFYVVFWGGNDENKRVQGKILKFFGKRNSRQISKLSKGEV